jgi:hypothetical protein
VSRFLGAVHPFPLHDICALNERWFLFLSGLVFWKCILTKEKIERRAFGERPDNYFFTSGVNESRACPFRSGSGGMDRSEAETLDAERRQSLSLLCSLLVTAIPAVLEKTSDTDKNKALE